MADNMNYVVFCFIDASIVHKEYFATHEQALAFEKDSLYVYDTISISALNDESENRMSMTDEDKNAADLENAKELQALKDLKRQEWLKEDEQEKLAKQRAERRESILVFLGAIFIIAGIVVGVWLSRTTTGIWSILSSFIPIAALYLTVFIWLLLGVEYD